MSQASLLRFILETPMPSSTLPASHPPVERRTDSARRDALNSRDRSKRLGEPSAEPKSEAKFAAMGGPSARFI